MLITKLEAAVRQLNTAIQLFFEDRDSVAVCTLAASAGRVRSDLVEHHLPSQPWRSLVPRRPPHISKKEIYRTIDRIPNFLKHADQDPESVESFHEYENDLRLFIACDECIDLECYLSIEMQVFQISYIATNQNQFNEVDNPELFIAASQCLPGLNVIDRRM